MDGKIEAESVEFVLEHERFGVGRWGEIPRTPTLALPPQGGGKARSVACISWFVIPAEAGIQRFESPLDSAPRLRGDRLRGSDSP